MCTSYSKESYYAVIFTSQRTNVDNGYDNMSERMMELAAQQPGYLGVESARNPEGSGITVSYWETLASIVAWKKHAEHQSAQAKGRSTWYSGYTVRIAKVERVYGYAT